MTLEVEVFWSFRSPYSYLAAVELLRRRTAGQCFDLQVRPVLPMVMRGLPVPRTKRLYIVRDVKRDDADQVAAAYRELFLAAGGGALRRGAERAWRGARARDARRRPGHLGELLRSVELRGRHDGLARPHPLEGGRRGRGCKADPIDRRPTGRGRRKAAKTADGA